MELEERWRLAARRLAPDRVPEVTATLAAVEQDFRERCSSHQRAGTLAELLAVAAVAPDAEIGGLGELIGLVDGWS